MCSCLSHTPTRDLAHNPGMCPNWESNQGPFGSQASTHSTEPHQPGLREICNLISYSFSLHLLYSICKFSVLT